MTDLDLNAIYWEIFSLFYEYVANGSTEELRSCADHLYDKYFGNAQLVLPMHLVKALDYVFLLQFEENDDLSPPSRQRMRNIMTSIYEAAKKWNSEHGLEDPISWLQRQDLSAHSPWAAVALNQLKDRDH